MEQIIINESNVTIMVRDIDKAINFYKKIGLTIKNRWNNQYAMMETNGITIGLHPTDDDIQSSEKISLGFMVDDINIARAALEENNIKYNENDGKSGKYIHFHDIDGTILYFT
jgi:catechol 2,3-dioxygenase-like lactoylglutathione lyase family enzyme